MKRSVFTFSIFILFALNSWAQKNTIVTIGDRKIDKEEFEQVYLKNNTQLDNQEDIKTPKDYMDLFVDYKMKVIEAETRGFDTIPEFINELAGYREELAKPYLTDVTVTDSMVQEAYYRQYHERRASHILLRAGKHDSEKKIQEVYNKAIEIRNQFINGEKTFEELAVEFSEDPSAQQNKGDLGFFKVFGMVTEFEDGAYNTPVGEVSMPIKTDFGYHLIHVTDTMTITGEMQVAHIMKIFPRNAEAGEIDNLKNEMDEVYKKLQEGQSWDSLVTIHSTDRSTSSKGGIFRWINKGFNVKEFADAAFTLTENGQFTKPIESKFGIHIIKRVDFRAPKTFEDSKKELVRKVKADPVRSEHSKDAFTAKLKEKYGFKAYQANIDTLLAYLKNLENDTINFELPSNLLESKLYEVGEESYTVQSFINLQIKKKDNEKLDLLKPIVLSSFDLYENEVITEYESNKLEDKYPEFKQIMREYHDGMLLFSIMEQEVWNKAVEDSVGLEAYYQENKDQYFWEEFYEGMIIRCYSQEAYDSCTALLEAGIETPDSLNAILNKDEKMIKIIPGKWEKGTNKRIDYFVFGAEKPNLAIKEFDFVHGRIIEAGVPKTLDEARGLYISDYQKVLEDQWMKELRSKYKVKINKRNLKKVESL